MTAEAIAKALGGSRTGGTWTARWPANDDREPSLSIRRADNKSAWRQSIKDGRFPKPVKPGPETTARRCEDIRALIEPGR
jgi:prophage regulatory protein